MNPQLQSILQQVIQAFADGDSDGAHANLNRALQVDVESVNTVFELGITYAKANRFAEALAIFNCLQAYQRYDARIPYNLGLIYSLLGKHDQAIAAYDLALQIKPHDVETLINKGSSCIDIKNFTLALEALDGAISIRSDIPEAWSNKGIALNNLHLYQESLDAYNEAIKLHPGYYEAWANKSAPLGKLKRFSEVIEACDQAIRLKPDYAEAYSNKGNVLHELKRYDEAIAQYEQAIHLKPDYPEGWLNKGVSLYELKRYDEAIAQYEQAIRLKSDYAEAYSNKGIVLNELKRYDEAIAQYDKAISLKPDYAEAYSNIGNVLYELKRYDEAIAQYEQAIRLKSDYAEAYSNKGIVLNELKRYDEAIAQYEQAIRLKSDYAEAWSNKGVTLFELKRYDEAFAHYDKAISLKPDYAEALLNKGVIFYELKQYDEAIAQYEQAILLKPDSDWICGNLLHIKMKMCSWSNFKGYLDSVVNKVKAYEKVIPPFELLSLTDDALLHKRCSEIYATDKYLINHQLGPILKNAQTEKIRIGYFSADFKNHAVSFLTAELFELHDRSKFEIIAFSFTSNDQSAIRLRLEATFNRFIDVSEMSDMDVAELSRKLQIDIAVDLGGYTAHNRPGIFAHRAAPIQVSYIGYLGTMGLEAMDYLIADATIVPVGSKKFYSEKIVYLPSYQANDRNRAISDRKFSRQELGLPDSGFVFCCFNNNYKILPETFSSWMRILKATEGSVLFLYSENPWTESNLRKEAENAGVDNTRLVFGKNLPMDEYLARYRACDLFLDTFPYNAGATASDALWSGLPIVTLIGHSFASRMAASLLNAIGLSELIAKTREEYEALAVELANNPEKLVEIRKVLEANRLKNPLFDSPAFTVHLEAAYMRMYERYLSDLEPDHIVIK